MSRHTQGCFWIDGKCFFWESQMRDYRRYHWWSPLDHLRLALHNRWSRKAFGEWDD